MGGCDAFDHAWFLTCAGLVRALVGRSISYKNTSTMADKSMFT